MQQTAAADIVIFGGGIAGLWLLNRLRAAGFTTLLFESHALGGGQTQKSQGIIHGGLKYALQGRLTNDAKALQAMPNIWDACLAGHGEIDLSNVPILSRHQYLWSPNKFTAKFAGFLANMALKAGVTRVPSDDYPAIFKDQAFKGEVFSLNELVLDVPTLILELFKNQQDTIFKIDPVTEEAFQFDDEGKLNAVSVALNGQSLQILAQYFIFTAGAGNETIIRKLNHPKLAMQRRPLHMTLVKTPFDHAFYGHCLGWDARPRITITTQRGLDGHAYWYLGGQLAETGIHRDPKNQTESARSELKNLFPWLNFNEATFATLMVDRSEPKETQGLKPETACYQTMHNIIVGWPTKLALAPKLAQDILLHLQQQGVTQKLFWVRELRAWPMPPIASPIWEEAFCKNAV